MFKRCRSEYHFFSIQENCFTIFKLNIRRECGSKYEASNGIAKRKGYSRAKRCISETSVNQWPPNNYKLNRIILRLLLINNVLPLSLHSATPLQPTNSSPIFATSIAITRLVQRTNIYETTTPTSTALATDLGAIYKGYGYCLFFEFLRVYGLMKVFALNSNTHVKNFSHKAYKYFF